MNLNAPKQTTFIISVVLAVVALLSIFVAIPFVTVNAFWVLTAGFVVLVAGNLLAGF
jgi:predicted membrane channel-forming protein YqfA (hemolysin III family)